MRWMLLLLTPIFALHASSTGIAQQPAAGSLTANGESRLLCDQAKPRVGMLGAPRSSDVIMRSLRLRTANQNDNLDTMQALRDFHATTLAWAYIDDPRFIADVKQSGRVFGGAAAAPSYLGQKDGEMAEIIVYTRRLTDTERRGIEAWLADRYRIPVRRWQ